MNSNTQSFQGNDAFCGLRNDMNHNTKFNFNNNNNYGYNRSCATNPVTQNFKVGGFGGDFWSSERMRNGGFNNINNNYASTAFHPSNTNSNARCMNYSSNPRF